MRTCLYPSAAESVQVPPPLRDAAHNALRETTRNLPCVVARDRVARSTWGSSDIFGFFGFRH